MPTAVVSILNGRKSAKKVFSVADPGGVDPTHEKKPDPDQTVPGKSGFGSDRQGKLDPDTFLD